MKIERIYLSPGHNFFGHYGKPPGEHPMVEVGEVECVAGKGLVGDRFYDYKEDYKGQATFFSMEVFEALGKELGVEGKEPWAFRRNLLVRGVELAELIGEEFEVQGVRFLGTEEAKPCFWMEQAFGEGAHAALEGRGGLRVKILSGGWLRRA